MSRGAFEPSRADGSIALLAIAPMEWGRWTDRNKIIVRDRAKIVGPKCDQCLCTTGSRDELNADRFGPVNLHDRTEIALTQPVCREVPRQHDNIKRMNRHFAPPGYAVTKRGRPPAVGTNQTLRTTADSPVGPFRVARIM